MNLRAMILSLICAMSLVLMSATGLVRAETVREAPKELKHVGVTEHLGASLPMDAVFTNHLGQKVRMADLLSTGRPLMLNLVYYSCPMLCSMVLDATIRGMRPIPWTLGKEFNAIALSIDPKDNTERAAKKHGEVVKSYGRALADKGWTFLTGSETDIKRVADAVGFEYKYDAEQKQYAHPAVTFLIKPDGRVARYLYGIEINPNDMRLGLYEASQGRSMNAVERVILYCYHYDPKEGTYVLLATRLMKLGGLLTMLLLGGYLALMMRRERRGKRHSIAAISAAAGSAGGSVREGRTIL